MPNKKIKIIAVDDIYANRYLLAESLQDYEVQTVANVDEFWRVLEKHIPDLILLDIMLPEMDGFTIAKNLKQDDRYKEIPIIFVSAKNSKNDVFEGIMAGGVDYVTKPIDGDILIKKIQYVLEQKIINQIINTYSISRTIKLIKTDEYTVILNDFPSNNTKALRNMLKAEMEKDPLKDIRDFHNLNVMLYNKIPYSIFKNTVKSLLALGVVLSYFEDINGYVTGEPLSDIEKDAIHELAARVNLNIIWVE